jgi:hypothetical protein
MDEILGFGSMAFWAMRWLEEIEGKNLLLPPGRIDSLTHI